MEKDIGGGRLDYLGEVDEQQAMLQWATAHIDQLAYQSNAREHLGAMVDWIAHFTREGFGLQRRLMSECLQQRDHVLRRIAVQGEFRKRLARVYIDSMFKDPARVTEELRSLCEDLLQDAQTHALRLSEIVGQCGALPRLRNKPRQGQLLVDSATHRKPPPSGELAARRTAGPTHLQRSP